MRAHSPLDYVTKMTAVAPRGDCPTFLAFLHRVMNGDQSLIAYLRRVLGYALTGVTNEHALFFAYGTGANGKSVLMSTTAGIMGDYHRTAPIETFTATHVDRHPTDLAMLRGARLVTATETEEGRRWAESRIKTLTGGDPVSARFMRQDFFEYTPAFKLVIAGNHKPGLRSVDEAIRRRFHLIPFGVTIPPRNAIRNWPKSSRLSGRVFCNGWWTAVWNGGPNDYSAPKPSLMRQRPIWSLKTPSQLGLTTDANATRTHGKARPRCLAHGPTGQPLRVNSQEAPSGSGRRSKPEALCHAARWTGEASPAFGSST